MGKTNRVNPHKSDRAPSDRARKSVQSAKIEREQIVAHDLDKDPHELFANPRDRLQRVIGNQAVGHIYAYSQADSAQQSSGLADATLQRILDNSARIAESVSALPRSGQMTVQREIAGARIDDIVKNEKGETFVVKGTEEDLNGKLFVLEPVGGGPERRVFADVKTYYVPRIKAEQLERAEGGHSLGRHGPDVSDEALKKRLFTGIAPDDKLSPAPGASSRFISYEEVLETRQAAATALADEIAAAQMKVLEWKTNVLGTLPNIVQEKQEGKERAEGEKTTSKEALSRHRREDLDPKRDVAEQLRDQKSDLEGKLFTLNKEIETGTVMSGESEFGGLSLFGEEDDEGEALSDLEIEERKRQIPDLEKQIQEITQQLVLPSKELAASEQRETELSDVVEQKAEALTRAQEQLVTAEDERANPGKNLKRYLNQAKTIKLEVKDKAGAPKENDGTEPFQDTVELAEKYSVYVDHKRRVGTGFESDDADLVSLTNVFQDTAVDPGADPPTPKSGPDIRQALQALGLAHELGALVAFLSVPDNLTAVKGKGEKGGKIYKNVKDAGDLERSFTNYETGDKQLFDGDDRPINVNPDGWKAIQHFPTKDQSSGVQERAE